MRAIQVYFLHDARCFNIDDKLGPAALFALNIYRSTHFFYDFFADGQPKASSLSIPLWVVVQLTKIDEKLFCIFLGHANSCIDDAYPYLYKSLMSILSLTGTPNNTSLPTLGHALLLNGSFNKTDFILAIHIVWQ